MPERRRHISERLADWWQGVTHRTDGEKNPEDGAANRPKQRTRVPDAYRDEYDENGIHRQYRNKSTRLVPRHESQGSAYREIQELALNDLEGISTEATSPEVAGMRDTLATVSDNILRLRLARLYRKQRDEHNINVLKATQKKQQGLELMEKLAKQPYGNMLGDNVGWLAKLADGMRRYFRAGLIGMPGAANQRFYLNHREMVVENPNSTRDRIVIPIAQIGSDYSISQDAPIWMNGFNALMVRFGGKQVYPFGLGLLNVIETGSKSLIGQIEVHDPERVVDDIRNKIDLLKAAVAPLPEAKPPITLSDLLVDPHALVPVTPNVHPRLKRDLHGNGYESDEDKQQRQMREMLELMSKVVSETVSKSVARTLAETMLAMGVRVQVDPGNPHAVVPVEERVVDGEGQWVDSVPDANPNDPS